MADRIIHVQLLDEGTRCYRPVTAEPLGDGVYRITGHRQDPDEVWEFQPDDVVRCEQRKLYRGSVLSLEWVAVEKASAKHG